MKLKKTTLKKAVKYLFTYTLLQVLFTNVFGQTDKLNNTNLHPVSPTAFQFLKYLDVPVNKYTGVPNISIPLYQVSVDGVTVPISLSYHSNGIRVSQEASWVGLGWDMTFGSVIQTVNDRDDLGVDYLGNSNIKMLPDFYTTGGSPSEFPIHNYCYRNMTGWSSPVPINQPQPYYGYKIASEFYIPVNGDFDTQQYNLFTSTSYDSEPDIFTANFFGHSINFIIDFKSPGQNSIVVLNKKGYQVFKIFENNIVKWKIIVPSGEEYWFQEKSNIESYGTGNDYNGIYNSAFYETSSNIWMLTKIVTNNKKEIVFSYYRTQLAESYPNYSEKTVKIKSSSSNSIGNANLLCGAGVDAYESTLSVEGQFKSYSTSREQYLYVNSINFPSGKIQFNLTDRSDIIGAKKLDNIIVTNSNNLQIENWQFDYSYFDASSVGGNSYNYANGTNLSNETRSQLRLKLSDLKEVNGGIYTFSYNSTQLPVKNSYAQDIWGFYNGKINNSSLELNPNSTFVGHPEFGDNGNDRYAYESYAKACILEQIQYPTGGNAHFNFELNSFDNNDLLSDVSIANNISPIGGGLRIADITLYNFPGQQSKKTIFSYSGGRSRQQKRLCRSFGISRVQSLNGSQNIVNYYSVSEYGSNGVFSPSYFSSFNGIGYDMVVTKDIDINGNPLGKTEDFFWNSQDYYTNNSETYPNALNVNLPAIKNTTNPENGELKESKVYEYSLNTNTYTIKRYTQNFYNNYISPTFYGARIFGFAPKKYGGDEQGNFIVYTMPRNMVGFYPIQDYESLLDHSTTTEYDNNGNALTTSNYYYYDSFDQLISERKTNSTYFEEYSYTHAYNDLSNPANNALLGLNRLTELINVRKIRREFNYYQYTTLSETDKTYQILGDKVVPSSIIDHPRPDYSLVGKTINFDAFDNYGNPLQVTSDGNTNSVLWDYNNEYVIAEAKGAKNANIAYTSFEADGFGNWSDINTSNIQFSPGLAVTGNKYYTFNNTILSNRQLDNTVTYKISYWSNNGVCNLSGNGTVSNAITGITLGGWTYYEHEISGATRVFIAGNGSIDELRLYPKNASLVTYTYEPLVGMTSQCDEGNKVSYFEYDDFQRLVIVRNYKKEIVKQYCYKYAGNNTTPCTGETVYYNDTQSKVFYKNDCPGGQSTIPYTYSIAANTYSSYISKQDANNKAIQALNTNGQNYANQNGSCMIYVRLSYENVFNSWNYTSGDVVVRFYSDAAGTIPVVVNNLTINYSYNDYCMNNYMTNSITNTGSTYAIIAGGATLNYQYLGNNGTINLQTCYIDYELLLGNGYTIIY
jgi:hypothetical protein